MLQLKRITFVGATFIFPLLLLWFLQKPMALQATAQNTLTVCPAGPPICDFATIQASIDAAAPHDLILISPGTYTEQINLKSNITLSGTGDISQTIISPLDGPVVRGQGVTGVTMIGLTVRGREPYTTAIGLHLSHSTITLTQFVITEIHGQDFISGFTPINDGTGILITGTGGIVANELELGPITGGDTFGEMSYGVTQRNGRAYGIRAEGDLFISLEDSRLHHIRNGTGGDRIMYDCFPTETYGIKTDGNVALHLLRTILAEIWASGGCNIHTWCPGYLVGGAVFGISMSGGSLTMQDSWIVGIRVLNNFGAGTGVDVRYASAVTLDNNAIWGFFAWLPSHNQTPEAPCPASMLTYHLISIHNTNEATINRNHLTNWSFYPPDFPPGRSSGLVGVWDGRSRGMLIQSVPQLVLTNNLIDGLFGGSVDIGAAGILVGGSASAVIENNIVRHIISGNYDNINSLEGGNSIGIHLTVVDGVVRNNLVYGLKAGDSPFVRQAIGIYTRYSDLVLQNNTVYEARSSYPGKGIGLALSEGNLLLLNNVVVSNTVGISATATTNVLTDYQGLWANGQNYHGIAGGVHDVIADPGFADALTGDFHLSSGSPFVDVGSNYALPNTDFEGDWRLLDGDGDGVAQVDLGADEFWQGVEGSMMQVEPLVAAAGDTLTYTITIYNPSPIPLNPVILTSTLPVHTTYISGTLIASMGTAIYQNGQILWQSTLTPNQSAMLQFRVTIDPTFTTPYLLINTATIDDPIAGPLYDIQATTVINPVSRYLPIIHRP